MDILLVLLLILCNGVFAMAEIAIVSARKVRLAQAADNGHHGARVALQLSEHPTRFLSTVQIGITSIGILSGVVGEDAIAVKLAPKLAEYPLLAPYAQPLSVAIMVLVITYMSLIFGELVPKRLAMHHPERIAALMSQPMDWLSRLTGPLVRLLSLSTDGMLRLLGARAANEPSITEEEIKVLMEQGTEEGVFERTEQALVENIFRLDERHIASIMSPRQDIVALDIEQPLEANLHCIQQHPYARFPVIRGDFEQVLGILNSKDLLGAVLGGQQVELAPLVRAPLFVPATVSPMQLLEQFKLTRTHLALVVDEYGELEGLVTLNDVLEAIVGDLPGEPHPTDHDELVQRADGSWLIDGSFSLERFRDRFDIDVPLPGEATGNVHTLAGFMLYMLGRVPNVADACEWHHWRFEVVDMDRTRIDKLLLVPLPPSEDLPEA